MTLLKMLGNVGIKCKSENVGKCWIDLLLLPVKICYFCDGR
ncbi:hypothetical protein [Ligilactobacillus salivarius]|nr:hypothetical protein [Ligilactobacillus salivarius]